MGNLLLFPCMRENNRCTSRRCRCCIRRDDRHRRPGARRCRAPCYIDVQENAIGKNGWSRVQLGSCVQLRSVCAIGIVCTIGDRVQLGSCGQLGSVCAIGIVCTIGDRVQLGSCGQLGSVCAIRDRVYNRGPCMQLGSCGQIVFVCNWDRVGN